MVWEGPSAEVTFGKKPAYGEKVGHFINPKFWANSTRGLKDSFESKISTPGIPSSKVSVSAAARWQPCCGQSCGARLQFHSKKINISLMKTD